MDSSQLHFLDKYAINNCRRAYDHRVPQEYTKGTILHVGSFHSTATRIGPSDEDREGTAQLVPTAAETAPIKPPKSTDCVWVGMALSLDKLAAIKEEEGAPAKTEPAKEPGARDDASADKTANEARVTKRRIGRNFDLVQHAENADIITFDPRAKRVVVKKVKGYSYWALNSPDSVTGLSTGYIVSLDQIYFFREFRDDFKTSRKDRTVASCARAQAAFDDIGRLLCASQPVNQEEAEDANVHDVNDFKLLSNQLGQDIDPNAQIKFMGAGNDEDVNLKNGLPLRIASDIADMDQQLQASVEQTTIGKSHKLPHEQDSSSHAVSNSVAQPAVISIRDTSSELSDYSDLSLFDPSIKNRDGSGPSVSKGSLQKQATDRARGAAAHWSVNHRQVKPICLKAREPQTRRPDLKRHRFLEDDGYTADDDNYQQQYTDRVAKPLKSLIDRLQKRGEGALLHQIHNLAKCLDKEAAPAPGSALTVSLNIPDEIHGKDCSRMITELYSMFPDLKADTEGLEPKTIAWMLKGLRLTGSTIELPLIRAYLMAFNMEVRGEIGNKVPGREEFTLERLVDMICAARDHAEAIVNHTGSSGLKAGADEDFPYPDENGDVWAQMKWKDTRTA